MYYAMPATLEFVLSNVEVALITFFIILAFD
jgi:hypothetical protein